MQGFEIKFNVYAETKEEADAASQTLKQFISKMAQNGIAVTANKLSDAVRKWQDNYFVINYFK